MNCLAAAAVATLLLAAGEPQVAPEHHAKLDPVWSLHGAWHGVATDDASGAIYALALRGKAIQVDADGKVVREFALPPAQGSILRLAHVRAGGDPVLLAFGVWQDQVKAYDPTGKELWAYPGGRSQGIDDVRAADLDGDGTDETIVGFNGGGVHLLDKKGRLLWRSSTDGAWHVDAGSVLGDGHPQVVGSSGGGKIHVFGRDGKQFADIDAGCYVYMVRVKGASAPTEGSTVVVGCHPGGRGQILRAISGDGTRKWSIDLPGDAQPTVDSIAVTPDRKLMAAANQGGTVYVVEVETGTIVATVSDQGTAPELAWATVKGEDSPLLLVASGLELNAFRLLR